MADRGKWQASFAELDRGNALAAANGARFAVAILPFMYDLTDYPFLPVNRMIEAHCQKRGMPVRDLLPAFAGRKHEDLWVHPSDPHPNEIGHQLIAAGLADFILQERLLDRRQ